MLCRLFDNHKYMYIYLSIHQEYGYLGKQKISLYLAAKQNFMDSAIMTFTLD